MYCTNKFLYPVPDATSDATSILVSCHTSCRRPRRQYLVHSLDFIIHPIYYYLPLFFTQYVPNILSIFSLPPLALAPVTAPTTSAKETLQAIGLLSLPPEARFESFEALKWAAQAQAHALAASYAFVTGKGDTRNGRRIKHLDCKRAGNYRGKGAPTHEDRVRDRKSVKSGCQFSIKARERADGLWDLTYRSGPRYCQHNHPPADRGTFAVDRRLSDAQRKTLITNFQAGVAARQTAATLRQEDPNLRISHRDLYNITAKIGRARQQGYSPSEGLILELEQAQAVGEVFFKHSKTNKGISRSSLLMLDLLNISMKTLT